MNKILLLSLLITPTLWAQNATEEAIILNQELQFLEDSANNIHLTTASEQTAQERANPINTQSLEKEYFGEELEDGIKTKAAAPKRRSL